MPITGRVVAEDGQTAVADAQISLDGWPAGKSGADGTFAIAHARRSGRRSRRGSEIASPSARTRPRRANLKLAKGGTVSGSVRDVKSQLPVAGARVAVAPSGRFGSRDSAIDAITDAKGNFTIAPLAAGTYDVRPSRPGYNINGAQSVTVKAADSVQKALYGTARARISGSVADEDKRPVAAARLNARATAARQHVQLQRDAGTFRRRGAYSAPDGHFVLRDVEADSDLQVDALKRGYPGGKSAAMKLAPGEKKTGVMITIPRGVAVTGRVTDKDNKPLSGVGVEATEAANDVMGGMRRMIISNMQQRTDDTYRTGSDGTFSIRVKEGTYDLNFKREGYSAKSVRGTKVDANTKPIDVVLDPGVEISGRVTRGGAGVEGVNVRAMSQDGFASAVTGPDGAFRVTDLTPGPDDAQRQQAGVVHPGDALGDRADARPGHRAACRRTHHRTRARQEFASAGDVVHGRRHDLAQRRRHDRDDAADAEAVHQRRRLVRAGRDQARHDAGGRERARLHDRARAEHRGGGRQDRARRRGRRRNRRETHRPRDGSGRQCAGRRSGAQRSDGAAAA